MAMETVEVYRMDKDDLPQAKRNECQLCTWNGVLFYSRRF